MCKEFVVRFAFGTILLLLVTVTVQAVPPERPTVDGMFEDLNEYGYTPETVDAGYGTLVLKWMEGEGLYFVYDWWNEPEVSPDYEQLLWTNPADTLARNWRFDVYDTDDYIVSWSTTANPQNYFTLDSAHWGVGTAYNESYYDPDSSHSIYEAFIPQNTIPEPATVLLLGFGGLMLRRKRRV